MYEKWLADDGKDLELTKKQIEEIKKKIDEVQTSQANHEGALAEKETVLADKEALLSVSGAVLFRNDLSASSSPVCSHTWACRACTSNCAKRTSSSR
jgi:hypothetical protein